MSAKRILPCTIISLVLVFALSSSAFAHEMFWKKVTVGVQTVYLSWTHKNPTTGNLSIKVNNTYVTGYWAGSDYTNAISAWNNPSLHVECTTSNSDYNTYMCTTSEAHWHELYPYDNITRETQGYTELFATNGTLVYNFDTAYASSRVIRGANIYLKPNPIFNTTFKRRSTMAHELGHVLCLGHSHEPDYSPANPTTDPSIMSYDYLATELSYFPQNHELRDINGKYGYTN